jgi:transcriptional regulator with XRE-family HTH domain
MQPGSPLPRRRGLLARGRPPNRLDPTSSAAARFGVELRELRLAAGLRVKDLAGLLGFSATRVSEVENGKGKLSHQFVEACEHALPADGALFTLFELVVQEEAAERHAKLARRRGAHNTERPAKPPVQLRTPEAGPASAPSSSTPTSPGVVTRDRRQALRTGATVAGAVLSGKLLELFGTEPLAMTRALRTATVDPRSWTTTRRPPRATWSTTRRRGRCCCSLRSWNASMRCANWSRTASRSPTSAGCAAWVRSLPRW